MTALLALVLSHATNGVVAVSEALSRALYGAKKLPKTKPAERTIVIDMSEHLSYYVPAAALSGGIALCIVHPITIACGQTPREPIRLPRSDGCARIPGR